VCHKCGWPFPNPHPSAKHRRAHKKICGTIEGYKEEQTNFNGSDDDYKTPGKFTIIICIFNLTLLLGYNRKLQLRYALFNLTFQNRWFAK